LRQPYLHALLEIAAGPGVARRLLAPAFLNECQLVERIRSLVKEDCMSRRRILVSLVGVSVLTLVVGLAVVRSFPLKAAGTPPAVNNTQQNTRPEFYKVGNGVSTPIPIYKPDPQYTAKAKATKIQGTVTLWIVIGADGAVKEVEVSKPLDPGLDQNAENAIRTWKFQPATKSGQPVACKVMVEVTFKLF
jgi:TonB family protein